MTENKRSHEEHMSHHGNVITAVEGGTLGGGGALGGPIDQGGASRSNLKGKHAGSRDKTDTGHAGDNNAINKDHM